MSERGLGNWRLAISNQALNFDAKEIWCEGDIRGGWWSKMWQYLGVNGDYLTACGFARVFGIDGILLHLHTGCGVQWGECEI